MEEAVPPRNIYGWPSILRPPFGLVAACSFRACRLWELPHLLYQVGRGESAADIIYNRPRLSTHHEGSPARAVETRLVGLEHLSGKPSFLYIDCISRLQETT